MSRDLTAYEWMAGLLDAIGSQPIGAPVRQCPAHQDGAPSLSVRPGPDGVLWVRCFAGCDLDRILAALHCSRSRLRKAPPMPPAEYAVKTRLKVEFPAVVLRHGHPAHRGFRLEAVHDYGRHLLLRWRNGTHKELIWETQTSSGTIPGLAGTPLATLPLYREREVRMAVAAGEPVLLVESESSVDALTGWYATTWAGGAQALNVGRLRQVLGGYPQTVVIPDNDDAGVQVLRRLTAAGLAPHTLMPAQGDDARDLYRQLGPTGFATAVERALATVTQPHRSAA